MEEQAELNSEAEGADWLSRGKVLFGKSKPRSSFLEKHMEYVLTGNLVSFDINIDKPGTGHEHDKILCSLICICRRVEAGRIIECILCHEWCVPFI
jgi:hypothetical protein